MCDQRDDTSCDRLDGSVLYTVVINAGGQSQRMGRPKALLPTPPSNEPLLTVLVRRLHQLASHAPIVIANDPQLQVQTKLGSEVEWLTDQYGAVGPLGGIATALSTLEGWAIVVACDMPLLNPTLLRYLMSVAATVDERGSEQWDAVVPVVNQHPEPLHALYHARILHAVEARLAAGERRATSFLPDIRVRYIHEAELRLHDPELRSFINVNTRAEWEQVCALLTVV